MFSAKRTYSLKALNKPKSAGELVPAAPEQIVVAHTTELETSIQGAIQRTSCRISEQSRAACESAMLRQRESA